MVLFKRGNDFVKPDGTVASDVEVLDFLESLETETELSSAVEALTAGLAAGVSEELENTKEDLDALITATGAVGFTSALEVIEDLRKNLETQDGYILDLITISGADSQEAAKVVIAESIAKAGYVQELDQQLNDSIAQALSLQSQIEELEGLLGTANNRIAELEKPAETAPSVPAELEKELATATTTKKGK